MDFSANRCHTIRCFSTHFSLILRHTNLWRKPRKLFFFFSFRRVFAPIEWMKIRILLMPAYRTRIMCYDELAFLYQFFSPYAVAWTFFCLLSKTYYNYNGMWNLFQMCVLHSIWMNCIPPNTICWFVVCHNSRSLNND